MRPLINDRLVKAWDDGASRNPLGRALTLLACASPERSAADTAALSIPERDAELLRMRRMTFGDTMRGFLGCEACGASLEFETRASSLLAWLEALRPSTATWQTGNFLFSLRPANSGDLEAALAAPDSNAARGTVLRRCTTVHRIDSASDEPEPIDWEFEQTVVKKFEEVHEGAEIFFNLNCPSCGKNQKAPLDIAQFVWSEVRAAATGLLREVHDLARAYGWTEAAILGMNGTRRRAYLEMVRA
jgi:hypothetical protein